MLDYHNNICTVGRRTPDSQCEIIVSLSSAQSHMLTGGKAKHTFLTQLTNTVTQWSIIT